MKRVVLVVTMLTVALGGIVFPLWAEEATNTFSTTLTLKNDEYFPSDGGKPFDVQRISVYTHWGDHYGLGSDLNVMRKTDYFQIKPYGTLNSGPWYLVAGGAFSDVDSFVQAGFWYVQKHYGFDVFVDVRNYFGLDGRSRGYLDSFIEITHPIGKSKFFIGINAENNHWWDGGHEWYQVGPVAGYNFGKVAAFNNLTIFGRIAREWDDCYRHNTQADSFRVGFSIQF